MNIWHIWHCTYVPVAYCLTSVESETPNQNQNEHPNTTVGTTTQSAILRYKLIKISPRSRKLQSTHIVSRGCTSLARGLATPRTAQGPHRAACPRAANPHHRPAPLSWPTIEADPRVCARCRAGRPLSRAAGGARRPGERLATGGAVILLPHHVIVQSWFSVQNEQGGMKLLYRPRLGACGSSTSMSRWPPRCSGMQVHAGARPRRRCAATIIPGVAYAAWHCRG